MRGLWFVRRYMDFCAGGTRVKRLAQKTGSEDHRLVAVKKNAVFDVPADGAGQDDLLQVAAFANEILDGVAMRDADHVLLDDGTVVEDFADIVTGRADQFDAALKGLMVGLGANEGG